MKKLLTIFLVAFGSAYSQTTPLSFTPLSGDFSAPNRGAEHWGSFSWNDVNAPTIPAGNTTIKVYYLRFNWQDIESNTVQGSYNWTVFDNAVNAAIDAGAMFKVALMAYCTSCGPLGTIPIYVQNLMTAEGKPGPVVLGDVLPNYQSTQWVNRYSALMRAVANHIAVTSRSGKSYTSAFLCYDMRHVGDFGEGVGWPSPGTIPSSAQITTLYMKRMIDSARTIFQNVQLTIPMNYVAPNNNYSLAAGNPDAESAFYALTASNPYGRIGWRRDNIGDDGYNDYITGTTATYLGQPLLPLLMNAWKVAPIGGEPANDQTGVSRCGSIYCDVHNEDTLFHMTYFGNGNYPITGPSGNWTTLTTNMRAASAEQGYKLKLDTGSMTTNILSGNAFNITIKYHNTGLAPIYESWKIVYELRNNSGGAVVWSGISRLALKLFQPSTTATTVSDNFSMNNSIPAGTYTMYVIIRDPAGYKLPLPLAITGRQADGSYPIRTGIVMTSTPLTDSLTLINIWGESNAAGNADNSGAPANELGVRSGVKILYHPSSLFQTLNIGVNNYQDNFITPNPQLHHGLELSLANEVDSGHLPNPTYLVSDGVSGSFICQWFPGAEGLACRPSGSLWDGWVPFVDAAVTQMNALGKPYRFYVWQSIGLNDEFGRNTPIDTFANRMQKYRTLFRNRYSRPDIVFLGTNFNNPPLSTLPTAWDNVYKITMPGMDAKYHEAPVLGTTYVDGGTHFDYLGFKLIGKNMVDIMMAIEGVPSSGGGSTHGPPIANITPLTNTITLPASSITLSGIGSIAQSPASITAYQWSLVSGPNTPIFTTPTASTTNVTGLIAGNYVFGLQVTDDSSLVGSNTSTLTVNPVPGTGISIFTTQLPQSDTQNEFGPLELGVKFRSAVAGYITAVRFYKTLGNTGTHIGELYTSLGTRLAQATFTGETASGWQTVTFASPVPILANTTYVAAYFSPNGFFVSDANGMASAIVNAPLTALANGTDGPNGVFLDTAVPAFPTDNCCIANYWVDVLFAQTLNNPCNCHQRPSGSKTVIQ